MNVTDAKSNKTIKSSNKREYNFKFIWDLITIIMGYILQEGYLKFISIFLKTLIIRLCEFKPSHFYGAVFLKKKLQGISINDFI